MKYEPVSNGRVTFGDGFIGRVLGKGTLNVEGFPRLKNVLHVEGLKANLISISQICDSNLHVNFSRDKCFVMNEFGNCVLEGTRSLDNCYTLSQSYTFHNENIEESANVIIDNLNDFAESMKKEKINSFTDEAVIESGVGSHVVTPDNVATRDDVSTSTVQGHIEFEKESVPSAIFKNLIRKKPLSQIKGKRHSDLLMGNVGDCICARKRYMKMVRYVSCSSLIMFWVKAMQNEVNHVIRKLIENKTNTLEYVETEKLLANIFIKALDFVRFDSLRRALGICLF